MTRKRFVQHPVTHELVPAEQYRPPQVEGTHMIMPDIAPYRSMVTGEIIGSRSRHREHLRQHGMVEVGNEIKHLTRNCTPPGSPPGLHDKVVRAYKQHLRKD